MPELVLINGDEELLKERAALEVAASCLVHNILQYQFPDDLGGYLEDSQLTPIGGGVRVFLVFDVETVPELPSGETDVLVCVSALKKKLKDQRARRLLDFPRLKSFDDNNEVIRWIHQEGDSLNIDLSRVASALFASSGNSLRKLSSEIRKLAILTPSGKIVSPDDARSVLCFSTDLTPKHIIDALCQGNPAKALTFYDKLQDGADETGWIIAFLQRHVLQQLRVERLFSSGMGPDEVAESLKIHPFVFKKAVRPRVGLWSIPSLFASVSALGDLDILHKGGSVSARAGLELEIVRLSEEARKNVEQRSNGPL